MRSLAFLALFAATPALAQQGTPPAPGTPPARPGQPPATIIAEPVAMMIAAFDKDGDARVTRAEFDAGVTRSFEAVDTGKTGSIGYIRFADWAEQWLGSRGALPEPFEVDRNDDNRITADELLDRFALFFTRFDADKDGSLARSELLTVRTPGFQDPRRRGQRQ
jgi:hypothetical protein